MELTRTPANISLFLALLACLGVWYLIWRSRLGYELRAFGHSEKAAVYAGISARGVLESVWLKPALEPERSTNPGEEVI